MKTLSQNQFTAVQDAIDSGLRASKRGTPEREAAQALSDAWDAVNALPVRTAAEREARLVAIAEFATSKGLV